MKILCFSIFSLLTVTVCGAQTFLNDSMTISSKLIDDYDYPHVPYVDKYVKYRSILDTLQHNIIITEITPLPQTECCGGGEPMTTITHLKYNKRRKIVFIASRTEKDEELKEIFGWTKQTRIDKIKYNKKLRVKKEVNGHYITRYKYKRLFGN